MDGRRSLVWIGLAAALVVAHGESRPATAAQSEPGKLLVYNHVLEAETAMDRLVHQTYDASFQVVDFTDQDHVYIPPRLAEAARPNAPLDNTGKAIKGTVQAFFIVTAEGRVLNPVVITSSDPRLNAAVLESLSGRMYRPARIDGWNVAATAGEEFTFPLPPP